MISEQYQFLFVHIPKTAGNAMQGVLLNYSEDLMVVSGGKDGVHRYGIQSAFGTEKHSTLADYHAALGDRAFWSKTRIACIRNPWDRAISFYFSPHRGRAQWKRQAFIELLDELLPMVHYLRLPQDPPGPIAGRNLHYLIRFEHLQADFDQVCKALGIGPHRLPIRNSSARAAYREYYDAELAQIVGERFAEDIEAFGYRFDEPAGSMR